MDALAHTIGERYLRILDRIAGAALASGREPGSVRLVVVTKAQPFEVVKAAIAAGVTILGENYPEEAVEKIQVLDMASKLEWHMIGHVQSRKAHLVIEHFALLHALDNLRLASRLDRFAARAGRTLPVLLEFNVGGEESKFGWPAWQEEGWTNLLPVVSQVLDLSHLRVHGLMAMPPLGADVEQSRPYFRRLRCLRDFLCDRFPQIDWRELSMGTSADFEVAVQEGATLVRVGQAILGTRPA